MVGIVSCYGRRSEFRIPGTDKRFLSSGKPSRPALGHTQLPIQWVVGYLPGHEVNHSPPSSVKVKNEWSCTSIPLIYF